MNLFTIAEKRGNTGILPKKCVYSLLHRMFYGVNVDEDYDAIANAYTSRVSVSYDYTFTAVSQLSRTHARNTTSIKALDSLCKVTNQFTQRKRNYNFPPNFANRIQE